MDLGHFCMDIDSNASSVSALHTEVEGVVHAYLNVVDEKDKEIFRHYQEKLVIEEASKKLVRERDELRESLANQKKENTQLLHRANGLEQELRFSQAHCERVSSVLEAVGTIFSVTVDHDHVVESGQQLVDNAQECISLAQHQIEATEQELVQTKNFIFRFVADSEARLRSWVRQCEVESFNAIMALHRPQLDLVFLRSHLGMNWREALPQLQSTVRTLTGDLANLKRSEEQLKEKTVDQANLVEAADKERVMLSSMNAHALRLLEESYVNQMVQREDFLESFRRLFSINTNMKRSYDECSCALTTMQEYVKETKRKLRLEAINKAATAKALEESETARAQEQQSAQQDKAGSIEKLKQQLAQQYEKCLKLRTSLSTAQEERSQLRSKVESLEKQAASHARVFEERTAQYERENTLLRRQLDKGAEELRGMGNMLLVEREATGQRLEEAIQITNRSNQEKAELVATTIRETQGTFAAREASLVNEVGALQKQIFEAKQEVGQLQKALAEEGKAKLLLEQSLSSNQTKIQLQEAECQRSRDRLGELENVVVAKQGIVESLKRQLSCSVDDKKQELELLRSMLCCEKRRSTCLEQELSQVSARQSLSESSVASVMEQNESMKSRITDLQLACEISVRHITELRDALLRYETHK